MWNCWECEFLNLSRYKDDEKYYCRLYGCDCNKKGYVCGWAVKSRNLKSELSTQGCSYFVKKIEIEQLRLF